MSGVGPAPFGRRAVIRVELVLDGHPRVVERELARKINRRHEPRSPGAETAQAEEWQQARHV